MRFFTFFAGQHPSQRGQGALNGCEFISSKIVHQRHELPQGLFVRPRIVGAPVVCELQQRLPTIMRIWRPDDPATLDQRLYQFAHRLEADAPTPGKRAQGKWLVGEMREDAELRHRCFFAGLAAHFRRYDSVEQWKHG